jgi:dipeptidyl aminopeptidase/acylaminoacyl peptidase
VRRVVLIFALLFCAPAHAQAPLPLEDFTRAEEIGGIKIAPDGKFVALATGNAVRTSIVFIDVEDSKRPKTVVNAQRHWEIDDFHWLSQTRLLVTTGRRYSELLPLGPGNAAFAVDRDGRYNKSVYCCTPYALWGLPVALRVGGADLLGILDARHIVTAEHFSRDFGAARRTDPYMKPALFRMDTYSESYRLSETAPLRGAQLLLDRAGNLRFAIGLNEHSTMALNWKRNVDGEWEELFLKELRKDSIVPLRFSADDRSVYLTGVAEGESRVALYRLDVQSQRLERVHAFENGDVIGVITDFADREVIGVRGYGDRSLQHWLSPDDPAAQTRQALHRAFPGKRVQLTSATSDGTKAIVFVDSDINPGDYYLFDTISRKADFLRAARAWIDPARMRPKEPIALAARDGLKLHGYVTRPAGDGPHPLVVMPHDELFSVRDTWEFEWEVQLLANRGYAVLQINHRGSSGYGMDFERAAFGEWGAKVQDDITDATHWAVSQGITRAGRICIFGKGYGGYAALMGAIREPDLYRCAIGYNGWYDVELSRSLDAQAGANMVERAFGSDEAQRRARSPAMSARAIRRVLGDKESVNARHIKAAVLLIYGEPTWNRDSEHAEHMQASLRKAGKAFETLPVLRHEAQLYGDRTRREVYEGILQFLSTNLMTAPSLQPQAPAPPETP